MCVARLCATDEALQAGNFSAAVALAVDSVRYIVQHRGPHDVRLLYSMVLIAEVHVKRRRHGAALE